VSFEGLRIQRRRYGPGFQAAKEQVFTQSILSGSALIELRKRLLSSFLETASATPFWQHQFSEYGIKPNASDPFAELAKLPVLTKDVVKQNAHLIINPSLKRRRLLWRHTSGTTGSGLVFPETRETEHYTWAFWWRYRSWHNLTRNTRCGYFGGRSVVPLSSRQPPYWRMNRAASQLMLSGYHLSRDTAPAYVHALEEYDVQWLHGYPSMLALLARYVSECRIRVTLPSLHCITTGAENLSDSQRKLLCEVFKVPVVQHYGQAEAAANISECEHGQLHIDEDFSAVELVPHPSEQSECHLIGTNWLNPAFPLLRYDTGDLVTPSAHQCTCGRLGRVIQSIDGRKEDYLVLPSGAHLGRLDHILKDMVNVKEAQFLQSSPATVTVRVVRGVDFTSTDEHQLLKEIRQRIGSEIGVTIEYVESIPRGANGKLRLVVSTIAKM
jgi:phenylacetate-CoA ligase